MGKRRPISTTSSLSSISEDSTFGVEGEDLPPQVPKRRRSFGSHRSISFTGDVSQIIDESETLESIHEENAEKNDDDVVRSSRSSSRRSSSNRKRSRHSSSSSRAERNAPSSHKSSRSDRCDGSPAESSRTESSRRSSTRRRSSSSHQRSSSSSIASESKEDPDTSDRSQQEEKLKEMAKRKSSTRSRRSPSSSSSERDNTSNDDEALKQSEAQERRRSHRSSTSSSSSRRRRRQSRSSSRRSSSNQSTAEVSESDVSTQFSRNLDRRGAQHEFRRNTSQEGDEVSLSDDDSEDESRPGAYRVSSYHSSRRVMTMASLGSSSGNTFVPENSLEESNSSFSESHLSLFSDSNTGTVTAEVARDMTDEIEAARQQGRAEGFRQASNRNHSVVASVARPSRRKPKVGVQERRNSRKKWLLFLVFGFCIIVAGSVSAYFALNRKKEDSQQSEVVTSPPTADENSGLEAVISFDPPTTEDCASIANGTAVAGQEDMFTQFVDMHVQMTSASEQDKALLLKLLEQQIQLNLLPRLVGCNQLNGNVIGNGVIDSVSNETSTCLFQNNPLCLEVVLTVKIYLRREEDGDKVLEIMSELLLDEDLNETLELPPNVETVGDPFITGSNHATNVPTETPSWSPSAAITLIQPSATPTMMVVDTPSASPLAPTVAPMEQNLPTGLLTSNPTIEPTRMETRRPTPTPSPLPISRPVLDYQVNDETDAPVLDYQEQPSATPSAAPSSSPTKNPSATPSASPSKLPTASPSISPSASPSLRPTRAPSTRPSTMPSRLPTPTPSETPTLRPSAPPTSVPSSLPTLSPTRLPTAVYWAIGVDQKCPRRGDRLFKIDNVADVDECYNACSSTPGCFVFSVGMNAGEQNCMGCRTPDTLEPYAGFTAYRYQLPTTDGYSPVEINKKCPLELTAGVTHPDRLFKIDNVADTTECYNACSSTTGCAVFSVGMNGSQLNCIGCTTTATLEHHLGFYAFELTP